MRRTQSHSVTGANSLRQVYRHVPFWRVLKNVLVIQLARYAPFFEGKNWLYRNLLGMAVGKDASVALMVMPDILYPQLISIGENTIIGYNTTILAHEYLVGEYRIGPVEIGREVTVGANVTILPGVRIGDGAVVAAGALVNKDVAPGTLVGGVPIRVIRDRL